jgi:hypothetical protein
LPFIWLKLRTPIVAELVIWKIDRQPDLVPSGSLVRLITEPDAKLHTLFCHVRGGAPAILRDGTAPVLECPMVENQSLTSGRISNHDWLSTLT